MKLAFLLFLSLSALFCSATHGSAASTSCPAIEKMRIDGDIAAAIGAIETTSPTDEAAPSALDLVPDLAHCAVGHPAIRAMALDMPAARREDIRLLSEAPVRGRWRDRVERPPSGDIS